MNPIPQVLKFSTFTKFLAVEYNKKEFKPSVLPKFRDKQLNCQNDIF